MLFKRREAELSPWRRSIYRREPSAAACRTSRWGQASRWSIYADRRQATETRGRGWNEPSRCELLTPLASAGFKVYFTNRWPGMAPIPLSPTLPSGMPRRFSTTSAGLWTCWVHSTGGSLALQLIADRPDVVRKAVVASAAYTLGPVARVGSWNCCMPSRRPVATLQRPSWTGCEGTSVPAGSGPCSHRSRLWPPSASRSKARRTRSPCCALRTPSTSATGSAISRLRP